MQIRSAQPRVAGPKAPRDQRFDRGAKQLIARVAEQPLCLSVHQADPTVGIHNHERVQCRRQCALQERITAAHLGRHRRLEKHIWSHAINGYRGVGRDLSSAAASPGSGA